MGDIIGGVLGGVFGASGAEKAADAQVEAAREAAEVQREIYYQGREDLAPWRASGGRALDALRYELGLGGIPSWEIPGTGSTGTGGDSGGGGSDGGGGSGSEPGYGEIREVWDQEERGGHEGSGEIIWKKSYYVGDQKFGDYGDAYQYWQEQNPTTPGGDGGGGDTGTPPEMFEYRGFEETPGYQFRLSEGQKAIERSNAARGLLSSGPTAKSLAKYGQGLASEEYGNYLNRLSSMAGLGQTATNTTAGLGANYATGAAQSISGAGNARASGYMGQANAWSGAINNVMGSQTYQSLPSFGDVLSGNWSWP